MTGNSIDDKPGTVRFPRFVVFLLAAAIFINYLDRGNFATAAPLLKGELRLTNAQIGILLSAFFWTYTPGQILAGWLIDRINAYRALAIGLALWSLATLLTGLAGGFAALLGLRILLGIGESAGFPASSKLLAQHVPAHKLGSANSWIAVGTSMGPAVGTLFGGLLMARAGWRPLFLVFGGLSLLWLAPWLIGTRSLSAARPQVITTAGPTFPAILGRRELWGASFGHFAITYAFYLVVSWTPLYLVKAQGYSLTQMGELAGAIYTLAAVCALAAGWISDRWMARGASSTRVRKTMVCGGTTLGAASLLACALGGPKVAIYGLVAYAVAHGMSSFNMFAIGQTLAGPDATGKWIGVQNALGNFSGILAPIITGVIIDRTGRFSLAFAVAAAILLLGALSWGVVVRRIEPLDWGRPDGPADGEPHSPAAANENQDPVRVTT